MLSALVVTRAGQFELEMDPNITSYADIVRGHSSRTAQNEVAESWMRKFQKEDEGEAIKRAVEASIKVSHQHFVSKLVKFRIDVPMSYTHIYLFYKSLTAGAFS